LTPRCDLLIVAAFVPELDALGALLGAALAKRIGEVEVRAAPVGVGLVQAAVGTTLALDAHRPRAVVLVGTCGAYPESRLVVGQVVVAKGVALVDPAALEGRSGFPDVMSRQLVAHGTLARAIAGSEAPLIDVVTTMAVTTDDALALSLGKHGGVEHLEAFAVGSACDKAGVPFVAALGVANRVGSTGRSEWRANHLATGRAAVDRVVAWIEAGAGKVLPSGSTP
jgi:futalosine hydrolase